MKLIYFSIAALLLIDVYWYLRYNKGEVYWIITGVVLRLTVGRGIKKKVIRRHDHTPYLIRYTIHTNRMFSIKLHKILESDDACLHDHPWAFISIILKNGYKEHTFKYKNGIPGYLLTYDGRTDEAKVEVRLAPTIAKTFKAPAILFRRARWAHRLEITKPALTLLITFNKVRDWGFFTSEGWIFWRNYEQENQCE